ncbi:hypothetical protein E4U36_007091 [Claviceps purpurea]|nr:hypothetical protein E4U36_007091 [Claviceps purpurea]
MTTTPHGPLLPRRVTASLPYVPADTTSTSRPSFSSSHALGEQCAYSPAPFASDRQPQDDEEATSIGPPIVAQNVVPSVNGDLFGCGGLRVAVRQAHMGSNEQYQQ